MAAKIPESVQVAMIQAAGNIASAGVAKAGNPTEASQLIITDTTNALNALIAVYLRQVP